MLSGASPSATSPRMALQGVRATATEIRAQRKKGLGRCRGRGFAGDQWLLVPCGAPVCSVSVTEPADAEEKSPGSWTTGGNRDRARSQWNYRTVVEAPWVVVALQRREHAAPAARARRMYRSTAPLRHDRDYPLTGHDADMLKSTRMTHLRHWSAPNAAL